MSKIRVLLADDHAVLRAGLRAIIDAEPDLEVIGEAASVADAGEQALSVGPDVLVLDLNMPGGDSFALIGLVRAGRPNTRVLILTMHDDPEYARSSLAAGASGYVVKTADAGELVAAVRAVHHGRTFLDVGHGGTPPPPPARLPNQGSHAAAESPLSEREEQVLRLLADGYTNKQIADELELSVKTVETYRARVMQKLELHSRAELVRYLRARSPS
jgi:DNA-binding NarL/FixJ family response regulator